MDIDDLLTTVQSTDSHQVDKLLKKDLEMVSAGVLNRHYKELGSSIEDKTLILDMSDVQYIDSSGLGMLITLQLKNYGPKNVILVNVDSKVWKIFVIAGVETRIKRTESIEEALNL